MCERLGVQLPGTIDLRTGNLSEALRALLHEHAVIQDPGGMHDAAQARRHGEHPGNVIGIADIGRNHFDPDAGIFQRVQCATLVVGGNATPSGE